MSIIISNIYILFDNIYDFSSTSSTKQLNENSHQRKDATLSLRTVFIDTQTTTHVCPQVFKNNSDLLAYTLRGVVLMLRLRKLLVFCLAVQLFLITPPTLHAASCSNNWSSPSLQTMETELMYAAITEYANGERYFFMKQGTKAFDAYYLRGVLLIKGLAESDISHDNIFWLPMVFVMPASILTKAVPQGPCSITQKTLISLPEAEGEIIPISHGVISYHYQAKDKKSAGHFRGTMQFTPLAAAPSEDADLKSYKLVGRTTPYPVLGGKDMPVTTIAGLRRVMAAKAVIAKQDLRNQAMKERALDAAGNIFVMTDKVCNQYVVKKSRKGEITWPRSI